MDNLEIYNKVRAVPDEAIKVITGGKLKGKSDINPMWRIKTLTETFGMCGIGWRPEITRQWKERCEDGRTAAFCNINLYLKVDGEWSMPIPGNGGSMLTDIENGQQRANDEAYKMAYTDALSVACKMIGVAADVYFERDATKYTRPAPPERQSEPEYRCESCQKPFEAFEFDGKQYTAKDAYLNAKQKRGAAVCKECYVAAGCPQ